MEILLYVAINSVTLLGLLGLALKFFNIRMIDQQLELLSVLINAKDAYTFAHQEHVAALAEELYRKLPPELQRSINH